MDKETDNENKKEKKTKKDHKGSESGDDDDFLQLEVKEGRMVYRVNGVWEGKTAGGCMSNATWRWNPQIFIASEETKKVKIKLIQSGSPLAHIGAYLFKTDGSERRQLDLNPEEVVSKMGFKNQREIYMEVELKGGVMHVLIPCTFNRGEEGKFTLSITSKDELDIHLPAPDDDLKTQEIEGEWHGDTAGGCRNHPQTFKCNPQYTLKTKDKKVEGMILLYTEKEEDFDSIGFYVVKNKAKDPKAKITSAIPAADVVLKTEFTSPTEAISKFSFPPHCLYSLIPCTFDPDNEATYTLRIISDEELKLKEVQPAERKLAKPKPVIVKPPEPTPETPKKEEKPKETKEEKKERTEKKEKKRRDNKSPRGDRTESPSTPVKPDGDASQPLSPGSASSRLKEAKTRKAGLLEYMQSIRGQGAPIEDLEALELSSESPMGRKKSKSEKTDKNDKNDKNDKSDKAQLGQATSPQPTSPVSPSASQESVTPAVTPSSSTTSVSSPITPSEDVFKEGVKIFNEKPKKGVEYLVQQKQLDNTPEKIAQFLFSTQTLDKSKIGDYLGEGEPFFVSVLKCFVQLFDFGGLDFDIALRQLLYRFRLPREAQKIDRIVNQFASQYHKNNSTAFSGPDAIYLLAFATIMLNTDAHNAMVKKKMTEKEFLRNCKGINSGKDLPEEYLVDIYFRIVNDEIKMLEDGAAFPNALKKGWLQLKTRFWVKRFWFILSDSTLYSFKKIGDPQAVNTVLLNDLTISRDEKKKTVFHLTSRLPALFGGGSAKPGQQVTYSFIANNERETESWVRLLKRSQAEKKGVVLSGSTSSLAS